MNKFYLVILVLAVVAGGLVLLNNNFIIPAGEIGKVACTEDAKICPDGSSVGRIPPDCRFADCPKDTSKSTSECSGKETVAMTEGPYYKSGSPQRTNLLESSTAGTKLTITGYVFDTNCNPISNAWLDFWQADGNGSYDNVGYNLRGHQYTDQSGKYMLETVVPARYSGRTPHVHVKVRANENSPILTTQLFFPNESQNQTDSIFDPSLIMDVKGGQEGKVAIFNFVIDLR